MIARYNNISLAAGAPGLIMQVAGRVMLDRQQATLGAVVLLVGTALLLTGFAFYAKAKGRHPAWCLCAFLSCIGLMILACLKDHSGKDA